jgi:hypothetical protein
MCHKYNWECQGKCGHKLIIVTAFVIAGVVPLSKKEGKKKSIKGVL